jgi:hypothetical protein
MAHVIAEGVAHHVTQRGNARRVVFDSHTDRLEYLQPDEPTPPSADFSSFQQSF